MFCGSVLAYCGPEDNAPRLNNRIGSVKWSFQVDVMRKDTDCISAGQGQALANSAKRHSKG